MRFYGLKHSYTTTQISNTKVYYQRKFIKYGFNNTPHLPRLSYRLYSFQIPHTWGLALLSGAKGYSGPYRVYLYSDTYYYHVVLPRLAEYINIDMNTNSVMFWSKFSNPFWQTYWTFLKQTFTSFNRPFFLKVKFKGKGYYIFKNKKQTITPQFGHSHRLYLYGHFASVKFLSKTHIFIFGLLKADTMRMGLGIYNMRPINIFTGRGVRFNRQVVYKKQGKVSSYR